MDPLIGKKLGQYELIALIGEGGMASVYRAMQISMKREVAIKVIGSRWTRDPEFTQRFEREAQMIASLSHTHILKVFDYGKEDEYLYLVMEYLRGGTVDEQLVKAPFPPEVVYRVLDQVCAALDYAHAKGIVHRDLKPSNLMLDDSGHILLTDFGLAKILNETSALTQSSMAMGTPAYMSPEQWKGNHLDHRADIYALGVIAFQLLTGQSLFQGETPYRLMYLHLFEPPPLLRTFRPDLNTTIENVLLQALAKDPLDRFHKASEFAQAFRRAVKNAATSASANPATTEPKPIMKQSFTPEQPAKPAVNPAPNTIIVPVPAAPIGTPPAPVDPPTPAASSTPPVIAVVPSAAPPAAAILRKLNTAPLEPLPGTARTDNKGIAQVWVASGCFMMGCDPDSESRADEQPSHEVCITKGYWLDQFPVTNLAYDEFVKSSGYSNRQYWSNAGWQWLQMNTIKTPGNYHGFTNPQQPRVGISWYEADAYARWRGGRLPTEAEWEYAARGAQSLRYPWGNEWKVGIANVRSTKTVSVGSYLDNKSWVDAMDMAGNVWEWVADFYDENYYRLEHIRNDPQGAPSGKYNVLKGGSWQNDAIFARASARRYDQPTARDNYYGFRIVI